MTATFESSEPAGRWPASPLGAVGGAGLPPVVGPGGAGTNAPRALSILRPQATRTRKERKDAL
jgi:hypothetical protein